MHFHGNKGTINEILQNEAIQLNDNKEPWVITFVFFTSHNLMRKIQRSTCVNHMGLIQGTVEVDAERQYFLRFESNVELDETSYTP